MVVPSDRIADLRGHLLKDAPLAEYTSWQVGGPADYLYKPADLEDLSCFLSQLPASIPILWLGLGSNVLIRDAGISGVVIVTQGALRGISSMKQDLIRAEAGISCAQFARYTARQGLTGAEFMAGIPGTIGGALAMNAGCYGGETWQCVHSVEIMNRAGVRVIRKASEFEVAYRHVGRPCDEWFVAGYFSLQAGDKAKALIDIKALLEKRNAAQPTGLPNCGSVFRNPPGEYAARLIEKCELKGFTIGGASVSEKHANFIINTGHATAQDIETLVFTVQSIVEQRQSVRLIPEVCILGRHN